MDYNKIGYAGSARIAEGFKDLPNLQHLYMSHNNIGDAGKAILKETKNASTFLHL